MMVLITYDVETITAEGKKRLRRVSKNCINYGQRVQNSVFECIVDPAQMAVLRNHLLNIIDEEKDSIRFYFLGSNWQNKVEHYGIKTSFNVAEDTLIA